MFMNEKHILLTAFIVGVVLIESSFAIRCWDCNSYENKNCADPFDNHTISWIDCSQISDRYTHLCQKTILRAGNGTTKIIRGCRNDEPLSHVRHEIYEAETELCNHDGCNSARNHVPFILMIFATPVIVGICNIVFSSSTQK